MQGESDGMVNVNVCVEGGGRGVILMIADKVETSLLNSDF